jgi:CDP-diglyceride synthetase
MGMHGTWNGFVGMLFFAVIVVIPLWKILTKAGYAGAWALLAFVPVVNLIALWIFAFNKWPIERTDA